MRSVQQLIDRLGRRLDRSVALDDPAFAIIASTARMGRIDDARVASVLDRRTLPEVESWLRSLRLDAEAGWRRVPGHPEYATLDRVCFPIRSGGRLLGYLWVIDEPRLGEARIAEIGSACREIAAQLEWQGAPVRAELGEGARLALAYTVDGEGSALDEARAGGLLRAGDEVVVLRALLGDGRRRATPARLRTVLADALEALGADRMIAAPHDGGAVLVCAPGDASEAIAALGRSAERRGIGVRGVGEARGPASASGAELLARAGFAAELAAESAARSEPGSPASRDPAPSSRASRASRAWEALGAWTLLRDTPPEAIAELSPGAAELLARGRTDLAETWLVYLDENRDAPRSCARLHIGRATLYHRLQRIRECVGEEAFSDGWSTTSAHLALRLWARVGGVGGAGRAGGGDGAGGGARSGS
ncbi:helix-turn-helix domain-containing protein [Leucobacter sp.]